MEGACAGNGMIAEVKFTVHAPTTAKMELLWGAGADEEPEPEAGVGDGPGRASLNLRVKPTPVLVIASTTLATTTAHPLLAELRNQLDSEPSGLFGATPGTEGSGRAEAVPMSAIERRCDSCRTEIGGKMRGELTRAVSLETLHRQALVSSVAAESAAAADAPWLCKPPKCKGAAWPCGGGVS